MDATTFQVHLAAALRLCRAAADLRLPIEEMLAYVGAAGYAATQEADGAVSLAQSEEMAALEEILAAVGDVAAIGARLPEEPRPIRVPAAGSGSPVPLITYPERVPG